MHSLVDQFVEQHLELRQVIVFGFGQSPQGTPGDTVVRVKGILFCKAEEIATDFNLFVNFLCAAFAKGLS